MILFWFYIRTSSGSVPEILFWFCRNLNVLIRSINIYVSVFSQRDIQVGDLFSWVSKHHHRAPAQERSTHTETARPSGQMQMGRTIGAGISGSGVLRRSASPPGRFGCCTGRGGGGRGGLRWRGEGHGGPARPVGCQQHSGGTLPDLVQPSRTTTWSGPPPRRAGPGAGIVRRRNPGGGSGPARSTAWPGTVCAHHILCRCCREGRGRKCEGREGGEAGQEGKLSVYLLLCASLAHFAPVSARMARTRTSAL